MSKPDQKPSEREEGIQPPYLEIPPEELIDVAKHLWREGMSHRDAVSHAYHIIHQAHLLSGNLRHLNKRSHHTTESISDLVWGAETNDHGQPLRVPLLVALMKLLGRGADPTNASKRFNDWISESLRKESFQAVISHDSTAPGLDPKLHQQLRDNGWLRFYEDERGSQHLIIPARTTQKKLLRQKSPEGEHITHAYWNTTDVWWPEPDKQIIEQRKSEYLTPGRDAFLGIHAAERALERFKDWLELEEKMKNSPARKKQPKNESGEFVSPKDKGAGRTKNGQFGGTRKKSGIS